MLSPDLTRFDIQDGSRIVYKNADFVDRHCDSFPYSELFVLVYSKVSHREEALQRLQAQQKDFVEEVYSCLLLAHLNRRSPTSQDTPNPKKVKCLFIVVMHLATPS